MMDGLNFQPQSNTLLLGKTTRIRINLQHTFNGVLHDLRMRVRTSSHIQVMGTSQMLIHQVLPGETASIESSLLGKIIGTAEVRLERINARLGGHTYDFPDFTFSVQIEEISSFPPEALVLTCKPAHLVQNTWEELDFRLHNNSRFPVQGIHVQFTGNQVNIREGGSLGLDSLSPQQGKEFRLHIFPNMAGDLELQAHLRVQAIGQALTNDFTLHFQVTPDNRTQETHIHGDVLQVGRGNIIGNPHLLGVQSINSSETSSLSVNQPASDEKKIASTSYTCPRCGKNVPGDRFCDQCGFDFETGH